MAYSYLALGDSYTIGEQVMLAESFPYQTVQMLRKAGHAFYAPEIIAKTGWTTDELSNAIDNTITLNKYDIVSLLIGVNNQYRGRKLPEFKIEFEHLLQKAIQFSGNLPGHVFILSIPDWGITPFAQGKDGEKIAQEIDDFNHVCQSAAAQFNCHFIDITTAQRKEGEKSEFLAPDGLHPNSKEYTKWANALFTLIRSEL